MLGSFATAFATSTTLVIGEFRTRGPNGADDEFIELYNVSTSPFLIGGWTVHASDNAGNTVELGMVTGGIVVFPGCRYLFANPNGYSGSVAPDQWFTTGSIPDDGGVSVRYGTIIIDAAGMSPGSAYQEGTLLAPLTTNVDQSYERKPGGGLGSGQDTDDNATDFQLISPSDPQGAASSCHGLTPARGRTWGEVKLLYR